MFPGGATPPDGFVPPPPPKPGTPVVQLFSEKVNTTLGA
jgi:hypothetical protein